MSQAQWKFQLVPSLHFPKLGFLTGNMGVLHGLLVGIRTPASSSPWIVGLIPSLASVDNGYCP